MPAYPFLFEVKDAAEPGEEVLNLPPGAGAVRPGGGGAPRGARSGQSTCRALTTLTPVLPPPVKAAPGAAAPSPVHAASAACLLNRCEASMLNEPDTRNRAQQRENAEPEERSKPVPLIVAAVALAMVAFGVIYILLSDPFGNSALGDRRTLADLSGPVPGAAGVADGKQLFAANCVACHQATGKGLPGVFPPLGRFRVGAGRRAHARQYPAAWRQWRTGGRRHHLQGRHALVPAAGRYRTGGPGHLHPRQLVETRRAP